MEFKEGSLSDRGNRLNDRGDTVKEHCDDKNSGAL